MSSAAQESAAGLVEDMLGLASEASPVEGSSGSEASAASETVQEAETTADFDVDLPEDIAAIVDEPDFDAEVEAEVAAEVEENGFDDDEDTVELRKQLRKAQKEAEFHKQQRLRAELPKWKQEAEKFFPLADIDSIKAESRRAFLREAAKQHRALKPKIDKVLAREREQLSATTEQERAAKREEAAKAWGKPTAGGPGVPPEASQKVRAETDRPVLASGGVTRMIMDRLKAGAYE